MAEYTSYETKVYNPDANENINTHLRIIHLETPATAVKIIVRSPNSVTINGIEYNFETLSTQGYTDPYVGIYAAQHPGMGNYFTVVVKNPIIYNGNTYQPGTVNPITNYFTDADIELKVEELVSTVSIVND